jgi:hypothetical protein
MAAEPDDAATFIPTTSPSDSSRAPPESPGMMSASTSISWVPVRGAGLLVGDGDRVVDVGDGPGRSGQGAAVAARVADRSDVVADRDPTVVRRDGRQTGRVLEL